MKKHIYFTLNILFNSSDHTYDTVTFESTYCTLNSISSWVYLVFGILLYRYGINPCFASSIAVAPLDEVTNEKEKGQFVCGCLYARLTVTVSDMVNIANGV